MVVVFVVVVDDVVDVDSDPTPLDTADVIVVG